MNPQLNDSSFIYRVDPGGMYRFQVAFVEQCRTAHRLFTEASPSAYQDIKNVVIIGMGGSAAGGDFLKALCDAQSPVPCTVCKDYDVPAFVGPETLVISCSYSGNTEETLSAFDSCKQKGAKLFVVTSGGTLLERAQASGIQAVVIPGGQPPRTALGFMMIPAVMFAEHCGLVSPINWESLFAHLQTVTDSYGVEAKDNGAKALASDLLGKIVVIHGLGSWQAAVANRWKGQINENSKHMCFSAAQPELCHNEVIGWEGAERQADNWHTIVLCDGTESEAMKARAKIVSELNYRWPTSFVTATGTTLFEKMFGLTVIGDWVSLYLASLAGVDPISIDSINFLKGKLAEINR